MKASIRYEDFIVDQLKDRAFAAEYLSGALEENKPALLLLALRDVVAAWGGMKKLAAKTKLSRESLYKMLSEEGNPGIYSLQSIFNALGFQICVQDKQKKTKFKRAS
jgi:probable addiction module antidote protein